MFSAKFIAVPSTGFIFAKIIENKRVALISQIILNITDINKVLVRLSTDSFYVFADA